MARERRERNGAAFEGEGGREGAQTGSTNSNGEHGGFDHSLIHLCLHPPQLYENGYLEKFESFTSKLVNKWKTSVSE